MRSSWLGSFQENTLHSTLSRFDAFGINVSHSSLKCSFPLGTSSRVNHWREKMFMFSKNSESKIQIKLSLYKCSMLLTNREASTVLSNMKAEVMTAAGVRWWQQQGWADHSKCFTRTNPSTPTETLSKY